jgi:hypothetical protein
MQLRSSRSIQLPYELSLPSQRLASLTITLSKHVIQDIFIVNAILPEWLVKMVVCAGPRTPDNVG